MKTLNLPKGEVSILHAGPTSGKSFVAKASRSADPHRTGLLAYDTDDFIWLWRPTWFMDRLWAKSKSEESKDANLLAQRIFDGILGPPGIITHPEITTVILTNLWPPATYAHLLRASFFRMPDAMIALDAQRRPDRQPFSKEKVDKWFSSWDQHFRNVYPDVPRIILGEDDFVNNHFQWDMPDSP